ncbi:MAG: ATP/GTP-binding protein, partial [Sulfurimonadaceae bacterium]
KDNDNFFSVGKYDLLHSAVIYGANASGKSNLLRAMAFMRNMVLNKNKVIQSTDTLAHDPFRLNTSTKDASSTFEMVFFIGEVKYRYGFEADKTTVYSEWLFEDTSGRKEAKLFYRDADEGHYVNKTRFAEGYAFFDAASSKIKVSKNQLFLWKCDQNDGEIAISILQWFKGFNLIDGIEHRGYSNYTMKKMEDNEFKKEIVKLVKTADIGIDDISFEKERTIIKTYHTVFDEENKEVGKEIFELNHEELNGTQKLFKILTSLLDTLQEGKILLIDALDAALHPMLTQHLIKLFHDKNSNTKNAQLIFATHNTNLLKPQMFRRDQIWFCQKDKYGITDAYSLTDIRNVRKTEDFESQYLFGKYGGVPYIR